MRRLILFLLTLALAFGLAACGGDDEPSPTATPSEVPPTLTPTSLPTPTPMMVPQTSDDPATRAQLRVMHASPDLPAVNIFLDGGDIGRGFTLGNYHSAPLSFNAGDYLLRVVPAGENPDVATVYLSESITLHPQQSTFAVITGPADALRLIMYEEDLAPLPNDTARVNVIQAAPGVDNVIMQEANRTIVGALSYGAAGDPAEIPAGDHTFDLTSGPDTLSTFDIFMSQRAVHTVVLYQDADGAYDTISVKLDVNSETRVRILHASPDLDAVDVYVDDTLLAESLGWHESTGWIAYPSRRVMLRVVPAGQPDTDAVLQKQVTLNPNATLDLILFDAAQRLRAAVIDEDLSPTPPDLARFVFVHAVPGIVQLTVTATGDNPITGLSPISFGAASEPVDYPPGDHSFTFQDTTAAGPDTVDFLPEQTWSAGDVYLVVATGFPEAEPAVLRTEAGTTQTAAGEEAASALDRPEVELRVIHAMTDAIAVDVSLDGETVFENVPQGVVTAYRPFYHQPRRLLVQTSATGTVLLSAELVIAVPTSPALVTVFLFREGTEPRVQSAIDPAILIPEGNASVRILNVAEAWPRIVLARIVPPDPTTPVPTGDPDLIVTIPAPQQELISPPADYSVPTDPEMIPSGTYDLLVVDAETTDLILSIPEVTLESRGSYDLLLLPDASGQTLTPILIKHDE